MLKSFIIHRKKQLNPVEFSLLIYLLITLIPAILVANSIEGGFYKVAVHLFLIILIVSITYIYDTFLQSKPWIKPFRILYPLAFLGFLYSETDFLNNWLFKQDLDTLIAAVEASIFGTQPALEFSKLIPTNFFAEAMYFGYFAYYLMLIGLPIVWYVRNGSESAEKMVFIIIQSFLIFYLFFDIFPVAGPQFYFTNMDPLPPGYLFGFLVRTIQHIGEVPTAAFPSSHVALCLIIIYLTFLESRKIFLFLIPVALLLILSTVYIRAHYVIDFFGAIISAPMVYKLTLNLYSKIKMLL